MQINLSKMQVDETAASCLPELAQMTDGFSGADIALIMREAGLKALTEDGKIEVAEADEIKVSASHLKQAALDVKERVDRQR